MIQNANLQLDRFANARRDSSRVKRCPLLIDAVVDVVPGEQLVKNLFAFPKIHFEVVEFFLGKPKNVRNVFVDQPVV